MGISGNGDRRACLHENTLILGRRGVGPLHAQQGQGDEAYIHSLEPRVELRSMRRFKDMLGPLLAALFRLVYVYLHVKSCERIC